MLKICKIFCCICFLNKLILKTMFLNALKLFTKPKIVLKHVLDKEGVQHFFCKAFISSYLKAWSIYYKIFFITQIKSFFLISITGVV